MQAVKANIDKHLLQDTKQSLERLTRHLESMMNIVTAQREMLISIQKRLPQGQQRDA